MARKDAHRHNPEERQIVWKKFSKTDGRGNALISRGLKNKIHLKNLRAFEKLFSLLSSVDKIFS